MESGASWTNLSKKQNGLSHASQEQEHALEKKISVHQTPSISSKKASVHSKLSSIHSKRQSISSLIHSKNPSVSSIRQADVHHTPAKSPSIASMAKNEIGRTSASNLTKSNSKVSLASTRLSLLQQAYSNPVLPSNKIGSKPISKLGSKAGSIRDVAS